MKRVKFTIACLSLLAVIALGGLSSSSASEAEGGKCTCLVPNSGTYGIETNGSCPASDCYIILN